MMTVRQLVKTFDDRPAVDRFSLALGPGEVLGLVGPEGAGKSTTLSCLAGVTPATAGSISVCGYDLALYPAEARRQMIFVPETPRLFEHLSVWGQSEKIQERISQLLPEVQLVELASETMSRAHARVELADQAKAVVERELQRLNLLREERSRILRAFLPLGILACAVWVGMVMYFNVRNRRPEIGVLMAQGFRGRTVRLLIFAKAIFQGVVGGTAGFLLGAGVTIAWEAAGPLCGALATGVGLAYLGLAITISTLTCLLASWLPASLAVRTDPAVVLRQE